MIAKTKVLTDSTGIGTETGTGLSLSWARLKEHAFKLVDDGEIIVSDENGKKKVEVKVK